MKHTTVDYVVCLDCILAVAGDEEAHDIEQHVERELGGRKGHISA